MLIVPVDGRKAKRDPSPEVAPKPKKRTFVPAIVCVEGSLLSRCNRK